MKLRRIFVHNFRSFDHVDVQLADLNVIIGPNAAGKSNFVEILKFLHHLATEGLENAISLQGGIDYIRNVNMSSSNVSLVVEFDKKEFFVEDYWRYLKDTIFRNVNVWHESLRYEITLSLTSRYKNTYRVSSEEITAEIRYGRQRKGQISLKRTNAGKIEFRVKAPGLESAFSSPEEYKAFMTIISLDQQVENLLTEIVSHDGDVHFLSERQSMLESSIARLNPLTMDVLSFFTGISLYYLDPKSAKKAIPMTGKTELEFDGSNLALVLKKIIDDRRSRDRFFRLIQQLLPFVEKINVKSQMDKSLITVLKEQYSRKNAQLPAFLISDGTISVAAMIVILYFEKKKCIVIEEPERNLHPQLLSKLVEMMKDATEHLGKQIIITTHSSELIKHAPPNSILFMKRDQHGNSIMYHPVEKKEVQQFLTNEMGINDLFVMGLLEW